MMAGSEDVKRTPNCPLAQVKRGPTDDEIHQAHLDSIKVIHVEPPSSSLPQEPASAYLSGGLGLTLGLGVGGLAALSIPLLEGSGSASTLQGLSQRDALSLLSLQPFQASFLLQPDGGAATGSAASSGAKPGEAGGAGITELADIQQILKVARAAPNQMGLTLPPLAKAPGFAGGQGGCRSRCRSIVFSGSFADRLFLLQGKSRVRRRCLH